MLEPYSRSLLLDLLRPPEDYRLDSGIGTTYTLDLISLLVAPFAFSSFVAEPEEGPQPKSLEVLNGLHQFADRLTVFCQHGRIGVPRARYPQLAYLERSVIECRSPRGGSFHPKVWLLRFERSTEDVIYRLLCLSRNLTFDRSWDTALTLEGPLLIRRNAVARNHPLGDFIAALPHMAVRQPLAAPVLDRIARLQEEVRRVDFALPEGFSGCRFWPIGIEGRSQWPFGDIGKRMLVISPFVSGGRLKQLSEGRSENVLVSTEPALRTLGGKPAGYVRAYSLNESAKAEPEPDSDQDADEEARSAIPSDLHVKCYVADAGSLAHVWTGSANATTAAFDRNVEFLVELVGPKRLFGIDSLMAYEKDTTRFVNLLQEVTGTLEAGGDEDDHDLVALIDQAREMLLNVRFTAFVHPPVEGRFDVELRTPSFVGVPNGVAVVAWPITLPKASHERPLASRGMAALFPALSFEALTAFYAFEVTAAIDGRVRREAFVQNVPTQGLPTDRTEQLLRLMIRDTNRFVQFLLLLLGVGEQGPTGGAGVTGTAHVMNTGASPVFAGQPLLEMLVKALERNPDRLDQVARLVAEVAASPEGQDVLPPRFAEIWAPISAVRQRMLHGITRSAS